MWTGTILFVVSSISANSLLTLVVFPVPGRPRQTVLERTPPLHPRLDLERELPHLGLAEVELIGHVIDLEDLGVPKERLVPHEDVLLHLAQSPCHDPCAPRCRCPRRS